MHICFLTNEYPEPGLAHGGVGTVVQMLARGLVAKGHQCTVVGLHPSGKESSHEDMGVKVWRVGTGRRIPGLNWWLNARAINSRLNKIHQGNRIDIVEATELGLAFIRKLPGTRYIIRMHGGHHFFAQAENRGINPWKGWQERRSFAKAHSVTGVSRYVMDHTAGYLDFSAKRGPVIYNPAPAAGFVPQDATEPIPGQMLFAGTVCEKKGIRQLAEAMPMIAEAVPEVRLIVAGRDWVSPVDGSSYTAGLQSGLPADTLSRMRFLGQIPRDRLARLMCESSVCVMPSHMEAMPMAWLEALSTGVPFVGSRTGPGPELVTHGSTGLLCNPLDPEDIARQVIFMLTRREEALAMGRAAQQDVQQRFGMERFLAENIRYYQSLLQP